MHVVISQFAGIDNTPGLPLAAGCLIASARLDEQLAATLTFAIKTRRKPVQSAVAEYEGAGLLGFSLYPWNAAYSLEVARAAKQADPSRLVIAGGPAVPRRPESARALLAEHPALDVLVFAEGERTFRELLRAHTDGAGFTALTGIAYRDADGEVQFTPPARQLDLSDTASPYLDGTFDALLEAEPGRFSMAMVETNRGCPFSCTFCDWSLTKHVVEFPRARIEAELEWIVTHGFNHVCICDANFGIRPRDGELAEYLAELKGRHGRPTYCYFYLTKNNHRRNLETIETLHAAGIGCCVGLAIQDYDDDVLEAVKRDNIQSGESLKLREICGARGIPTLNELILGLPRQTYDSFTTTVLRAMPSYPGHDFAIYLARLLDNTEMADPEQRERFGLETRRCVWKSLEANWDPVLEETQELVVGTVDMPVADWQRTYRFTYLASAAYNFRLLRVVLQYLREELGVDLREYLEALCALTQEAPPASVFGAMGRVFERYLSSILSGGPFVFPTEGAGDDPRPIAESVAIEALRNVDAFYEEVRLRSEQFLRERGLEAGLLAEAIRYERLLAPRLGESEPREATFDHDWLSFATAGGTGAPLAARPNTVRFTPPAYTRLATFGQVAGTHVACLRAKAALGQVEHVGAPRPLTVIDS